MISVSPVMPGSEPIETVFGEGQDQYDPLPAVYIYSPSRPVVTRWRLTEDERLLVLDGADVVVQQLTFCNPLQPINLQIVMPNDNPVLLECP